ncbi:unnamed protein product [Durusdinium trenchii]|uniref:Uncharacterized protein n=1 Tax=Durusdinium trenchii TaxID=1381693 RepID=A0ABP0I8X2_9DINO
MAVDDPPPQGAYSAYSVPASLEPIFLSLVDVDDQVISGVRCSETARMRTLPSSYDMDPKLKRCDPTRSQARRMSNLLQEGKRMNQKAESDCRWWTRVRQPLVCPLTNFPIRLLPYPPFKLRCDPQKPSPHTLVDGKFLAMQLIVNGKASGIRELTESDIHALDGYMQRCKTLAKVFPCQNKEDSEVASLQYKCSAGKSLSEMDSEVASL